MRSLLQISSRTLSCYCVIISAFVAGCEKRAELSAMDSDEDKVSIQDSVVLVTFQPLGWEKPRSTRLVPTKTGNSTLVIESERLTSIEGDDFSCRFEIADSTIDRILVKYEISQVRVELDPPRLKREEIGKGKIELTTEKSIQELILLKGATVRFEIFAASKGQGLQKDKGSKGPAPS